MMCFFVSDLHGSVERYRKLFDAIRADQPEAVFLGGDLLPSGLHYAASTPNVYQDFIENYLAAICSELMACMGDEYPRIFAILGNDDPRAEEAAMLLGSERGYWEYIHGRCVTFGAYQVIGYSCVPPTPFFLKDWERYDVSRFVDNGCVSPEEGHYSVPVSEREKRYATMAQELDELTHTLTDLSHTICLFHSPPYQTKLDRAALDGRAISHVPLDVHVGSIAIRRFIEARQPLLTLHGHIHESARLERAWQDQLGGTTMLSAAHDGPELALVRFDPEKPASATRELL